MRRVISKSTITVVVAALGWDKFRSEVRRKKCYRKRCTVFLVHNKLLQVLHTMLPFSAVQGTRYGLAVLRSH